MSLLKGDKIFLRALELEDVDPLYRWENDTRFWQVSNTSTPFSRYTLQQYVETAGDIYTTGQLRLMICLNDSEKAIGAIDLFDFDPKNHRAGIGILVAEDQNRQQGIATEALTLMIRYCFTTLNLHQLYCNILTSNEESIHLFSKHGFKLVGTKKEWVRTARGWEDEQIYQRIRE